MNAPASNGQLLAARILAGEIPGHDYWPEFTPDEWRAEAEAAIECDDYTELLAMVAQQDEADREETALRHAEYSGVSPSRRSWMECV